MDVLGQEMRLTVKLRLLLVEGLRVEISLADENQVARRDVLGTGIQPRHRAALFRVEGGEAQLASIRGLGAIRVVQESPAVGQELRPYETRAEL